MRFIKKTWHEVILFLTDIDMQNVEEHIDIYPIWSEGKIIYLVDVEKK